MATANLTGATSRSLDITPLTPGTVALIDLLPGDVVGISQVQVTTAFDGAPAVTLGITGDLSLILAVTDVKLKMIGIYGSGHLHSISTATTLTVTFVAGGATVGAAKLLVNISRES